MLLLSTTLLLVHQTNFDAQSCDPAAGHCIYMKLLDVGDMNYFAS